MPTTAPIAGLSVGLNPPPRSPRSCPVSPQYTAAACETFTPWWADRRVVPRCASLANLGKCSQYWSPGTLVAIGLNSPRIASGAFGFMSQVSSWLGPPLRNTRMQASAEDEAEAVAADLLASSALNKAGKPRPHRPIPPTWSTRRRETGAGPRQTIAEFIPPPLPR